MNGKRFLMLATFGVLASIAAPAMSATNSTANVTVQWNTTYTISLNVVTNYNPANPGCGLTASTACATSGAAPKAYTNTNTGAGTCEAASSESVTAATGASGGSATTATVTIANISPDSVQWTDCYYPNAVDAMVTTTDGNGYTVAVNNIGNANIPAGQAANYNVCLFPTAAAAVSGVAKGSTLTGPGNPNGTPGTVGPTAGAVPAVNANTAAKCTGSSPNGQAGFVVGGANAASGTLCAAATCSSNTTGSHFDYDVEVGLGPAFQCTAASTCQVKLNFVALGQ